MNVVRLPIDRTSTERSLGPDVARALGAMLVVYLHACVPYLTQPMPGLIWPVKDASGTFCNSLFWAIEIFVMPLFLVISGVFSYRAWLPSNATEWVKLKSRGRRLLRPLLFAVIVILPIELYIWTIGLVAEGLIPAVKLRSLKIPSPYGDHLWGLSHLWYLLYVFLYVAVMAGVARGLRNGVPLRLRPTVRRASATMVVAVGVTTLAFAPEVVFGFQHRFLPFFSKWVYSGTFFAGGVAIAVFDSSFQLINRLAGRQLAVGVVATWAAVMLGCWTIDPLILTPTRPPGVAGMRSPELIVAISVASITVLASWCMTLGILGFANRLAPNVSKSRRLSVAVSYLAGASFWIYLVHHPIVGLVHIDLKWLVPGWLPVAKSCLAFAIAIGWGLVSYEALIRTSRFGRWVGLTPNKQTSDDSTQTPIRRQREQSPIRIAA